MTDAELHNYFYQLCLNAEIPKDKNVVGWNARDFWYQLSDSVYNKYGTELINPTHICETLNPFTIHFTWDDKDGNILGCSIKETPEVYMCFNNNTQSWREFLYLPRIQVSERLMKVFYSYYLKKTNGH